MTRRDPIAERGECQSGRHDFEQREFKRYCRRCQREEWLFSNPYPGIGEPKYEWRDMTFRPIRPMKSTTPRLPYPLSKWWYWAAAAVVLAGVALVDWICGGGR